jgi:hypothetical protein
MPCLDASVLNHQPKCGDIEICNLSQRLQLELLLQAVPPC